MLKSSEISPVCPVFADHLTVTCQTVVSCPHLRRGDDFCPPEVGLRDGSDSDTREANRRVSNLFCRPGNVTAQKACRGGFPPLLQGWRGQNRYC
jgi:hypothetical protein